MTSPLILHPPFLLALVLAAGIAGVALALKWLTRSGAIATLVVGTTIFWLGGGPAALALAAFFVSSSVLSVVRKASRKSSSSSTPSCSHARDMWQVLANGGVGTAIVVAHRLLAYRVPLDTTHVIGLLYLASLAAVNSDTWATEIGRLSGVQPRLLSTWRKASTGISGGVSLPGTVAAALGAAFIPFTVYRLFDLSPAEFVAIAWAGFLGSLLDSNLGAGVQGQFRSTDTGEVGDTAVIDGKPALLIRGLPWFDNNAVNFCCSAGGALFCWLLLTYALRGYM
jgi:uncharacterized protein (TIGR00297 family)